MSTQSKPTKRELREQRRAERLAAERAEAAAAAPHAPLAAARRRSASPPSSSRRRARLVVRRRVRTPHPRRAGAGGERCSPASPSATACSATPSAPLTAHRVRRPPVPGLRRGVADDAAHAVRDYVRTGKVKLEARTLHFIGPDSATRRARRRRRRAARAGCGRSSRRSTPPQGEENSGYVTDGFLRSVAQAAGRRRRRGARGRRRPRPRRSG